MPIEPISSFASGRAQYNAYRQQQVDNGQPILSFTEWAKTQNAPVKTQVPEGESRG